MKKLIITSALLVASLISRNTSTQLSNEELDRIKLVSLLQGLRLQRKDI